MMFADSTKFDQILKVSHKLLQIQDLDLILENMLTEMRAIIAADAGSVYLREGNNIRFSCTQNDTLQRKLPFGKKLIYSTYKVKIDNSSIAGFVANTGVVVNVVDAYHISSGQPYSFDPHFDEVTGYHTQSILTVPMVSSGGKVEGVIQLINAFNSDKTIRSFTPSEESIAQFFANNATIAISNAQLTRSMIMRINKMIELHDPRETVEHAHRVAAYSVEIYEAWANKKGIPTREIQHNRGVLRMAAMLHDIGKISVPESILKKNFADLTSDETRIMELHTLNGARLFSNPFSDVEEMAQSIVLTHHEKWDGSGYPGHINLDTGLPIFGYEKTDGRALGKKRLEIPIYGRIVALANYYDYLTYKITSEGEKINPDKATKDKAVEIILANSGIQFDPDVVAAFISCIEIIKSLGDRYENIQSVDVS